MCTGRLCAETTTIIYLYPSSYYSLGLDDCPGSSTVDPIDPNQVKAELIGNQLTIYESLDGEAKVEITKAESSEPIWHTLFDHSATLTLTETATYIIHLYHPSTRDVYGKLSFPISESRKVISKGQVLILWEHSAYTPFGMQVR